MVHLFILQTLHCYHSNRYNIAFFRVIKTDDKFDHWFQIEYSITDPRWYYPSLWYDLYYEDEAGTKLHLIVIDSQSLRQNKNNPAVQLSWLETTLASSTGDWVVVLSHHPPYSVGGHGPGSGTIRDQVSQQGAKPV